MNEINSSWRCGKVGDICEPRKGKIDPKKEPSQKYIALEHIHQQTGRLLGVGDSKETTSIKAIFKAEDVLFGKLRPYLRKYWFAEFDGVCATEILPVVAKNGTDRKFLYYIFQQDKFIDYLDQKSFGTKMPRTSWKDISEYDILIPSLSEQQKIADILTSVDNAISKTQAIIEQTGKVKKGLMQKLLTKGIGHTKFKQTEVGEIPEEWRVESDFIKIKSGYGFNLSEYADEGVPLIRINNVKHGELDFDDIKFLPETYLESYHQFVLNENDLILALNRPITQKRLKIAKISKQQLPAILYQRLGKLLMDNSKYNQDYIYYYLQSEKFLEQLSATFVGSDQPFIKTSEFAKLRFSIPPIEEQNKIVDIFNSVFNKMQSEYTKLNHLHVLKKGSCKSF